MSARRVPAGVSVLRSIQLGFVALVALASLWGLLGGCREQTTAPIDRNGAPETFLTSAPGDSQTTFYWVAMRWSGADRDGAVIAYEVATTESLPNIERIQWTRTRRTDSLIVFPVEESREVLGHRFYVRSIDNEGKLDPTPAWVFFGVRDNVPPTITFSRAEAYGPGGEVRQLTSENPDQPTDTISTGWGVRFSWSGSDADVAYGSDGRLVRIGSVAKFLHRLIPVESQYLGGTLSDTAAVYPPEFFDRIRTGSVYAFSTRAIDDAGLSGSGTATRSFVWNRDPVTKFHRCLRDGTGDSLKCFTVSGETHFEGDTLPLPRDVGAPYPTAIFTASGYDPDPVSPGDYTVKALEWRFTTGVVLPQWTQFAAAEPLTMSELRGGDYMIMARATDQLDRVEGTPDTVRFYVNISPRFVTRVEDVGFVQSPLPGQSFRLSEVGDSLLFRFWIENPDAAFSEKVMISYRFDSENEAFYRGAKLRFSGRADSMMIAPEGGRVFSAKPYVLRVKVEDNAQTGGSDRGARVINRIIPFIITEG
jgi:hypothetical protein